MSEISIDSASTVNRDQASLKTTHPILLSSDLSTL